MLVDSTFTLFVVVTTSGIAAAWLGFMCLFVYGLKWLDRKFGSAPVDLHRGFEVKQTTVGSPADRAELKEDGHPHG